MNTGTFDYGRSKRVVECVETDMCYMYDLHAKDVLEQYDGLESELDYETFDGPRGHKFDAQEEL